MIKIKSDEKQKTSSEKIVSEKEKLLKLIDVDQMPDFFMNTINYFLNLYFVVKNNALGTGEKVPEIAITPYFIEDKLMEFSNISYSKTSHRIEKAQETQIPDRYSHFLANKNLFRKDIFKNTFINKILFEEQNLNLNLSFQYQKRLSDQFDFIKTRKLFNLSSTKNQISARKP